MFICICNGLTERRIVEAVQQGAPSHDEVYARCDCMAQCYACAQEIDQIVRRVTNAPPPMPKAQQDGGTNAALEPLRLTMSSTIPISSVKGCDDRPPKNETMRSKNSSRLGALMALPVLAAALASCSGSPVSGTAGGSATPPLAGSASPGKAAEACTINPSSTIEDGVNSPQSVVFDGEGRLYVANFQENAVTVYAAATHKLVETIRVGVDHPTTLALDGLGKLYVANSNSTVSVYSEKNWQVVRKINVESPQVLAFDGQGNLYVAHFHSDGVSIFAPGSGTPLRTIKKGISTPFAMAFDAFDQLYVANHGANSVTVYAFGSIVPDRTVSKFVSHPTSIAIDGLNNLYVANSTDDSVSIYGPHDAQPKRELFRGVFRPTSLAIDSFDNLYVGNSAAGHGSVSVYAPKSGRPIQTLCPGITIPVAMGFDAHGSLYVANTNSKKIPIFPPLP
ncbi:MAG TPA: (2Fe-2S)-binding protein [Candidatus Cybelea sp.]